MTRRQTGAAAAGGERIHTYITCHIDNIDNHDIIITIIINIIIIIISSSSSRSITIIIIIVLLIILRSISGVVLVSLCVCMCV